MFYRVKQFVWALTAQITEEEKHFIEAYLTPTELALFSKLKVYEQKHCIKVAKALEEEIKLPHVKQEWVKVGLLHDIGKSVYPIGPIRKSMMVLLHKFTKGKIAKVDMPMVKCYYEHPLLGYEMLKKEHIYEEEFLQNVLQHHEQSKRTDTHLLRELKKWDNHY